MDTLTIPDGLEVAKVKSEKLFAEPNFLEYLEFTDRKINQICHEVLHNIIKAVGQGRTVNLIVPLNGGLLFYRKLMELFSNLELSTNALNIIFSDEDENDRLLFSQEPLDVTNAYNIVIDDIWDKGGTGSEIIEELRTFGTVDTLDYFAFCRKESSPTQNNGARLANLDSVTVFEDRWLHNWGGMNSSLFENGPRVTALERTSFLPLVPLPEYLQIRFNTQDPFSVDAYMDLLTQTNLAVNGVIPIDVFNDVLFLEKNPSLITRFDYMTKLHARIAQSIETSKIKVDREG